MKTCHATIDSQAVNTHHSTAQHRTQCEHIIQFTSSRGRNVMRLFWIFQHSAVVGQWNLCNMEANHTNSYQTIRIKYKLFAWCVIYSRLEYFYDAMCAYPTTDQSLSNIYWMVNECRWWIGIVLSLVKLVPVLCVQYDACMHACMHNSVCINIKV